MIWMNGVGCDAAFPHLRLPQRLPVFEQTFPISICSIQARQLLIVCTHTHFQTEQLTINGPSLGRSPGRRFGVEGEAPVARKRYACSDRGQWRLLFGRRSWQIELTGWTDSQARYLSQTCWIQSLTHHFHLLTRDDPT